MHKKVPRSHILLGKRKTKKPHASKQIAMIESKSMSNTQLLEALSQQTGAEAGAIEAAADKQHDEVQKAQDDADSLLHQVNSQGEMLQTQLLANGQTLFVIKKLAGLVEKMKSSVESVESHLKQCEKKVADLKDQKSDQAEDNNLANQPQVVQTPT